jgi:hypothetical protein
MEGSGISEMFVFSRLSMGHPVLAASSLVLRTGQPKRP